MIRHNRRNRTQTMNMMTKTLLAAALALAGVSAWAQSDHGAMQGGSPPPDARDPHAYSGGYTLPPERPLRLMDEHSMFSLMVDKLEAVHAHGETGAAYEFTARYGRDFNRLVLKAEGHADQGRLEEARTELLWGHALAAYWDTQLGVRMDHGPGPDRAWLAFGVQGLAPYWFEVEVTAYIGDEARTALRLEVEYELLFTQRLVLQPRLEANLYGQRDTERGIGAGLSDATAGLRLRYEIRREFAPYIGVERTMKYGATADYALAAGEHRGATRGVAGLRFWF
jgi:copper resistance protein B